MKPVVFASIRLASIRLAAPGAAIVLLAAACSDAGSAPQQSASTGIGRTAGPLVAAEPYTWNSVAMGGGGYVTGLLAHPAQANLYYARTDVGGAYRWDQASGAWIPLLDWVSEADLGYLGVESIAVDPRDAAKLYIVVGTSYFSGGRTAVLRSSDQGNTFTITDVTAHWKAHGNALGRHVGEKLAVDPNDGHILIAGSLAHGLWKSADAGATWTATTFPVKTTTNGFGISFVLFDPRTGTAGSATKTIYVGASQPGDSLYVSKDGGATWSAVAGHTTTAGTPVRAALASDGGLWITYEGSDGGIFRYDTGAGTWADRSPAGVARQFGGIAVDPANSLKLAASTFSQWLSQPWGWGDRLFFSTDGGATWTDIFAANRGVMDDNGFAWIQNHALHWAGSLIMDPVNSERVMVGSGNGIFGTDALTAAKSTWKAEVKGMEETVPLDLVTTTAGALMTGLGDISGFVHTDLAVSAVYDSPASGNCNSVAAAYGAPTVMVRACSNLFFSTNAGGTWTASPTLPVAGAKQGEVAISADGAAALWRPSGAATTYRTTNRGATWTAVNGLDFGATLVADTVNANKLYSLNTTTGALWVSTDMGVNFAAAGSPGPGGAPVFAAAPGREGHLWVAMNGGGITRSSDSGTTFTKLSGTIVAASIGLGKQAPGGNYPAIYIWGQVDAGPTGIYRSTDSGATWARVNDDQHQYGGPGNAHMIVGDLGVYGRVFMSSAGRGVIYGQPGSGSSDAGAADGSSAWDAGGHDAGAADGASAWDAGGFDAGVADGSSAWDAGGFDAGVADGASAWDAGGLDAAVAADGSSGWDAGGGPDASARDGSVDAATRTVDASVSPGKMDSGEAFSCSCEVRGGGRNRASGAWSLGVIVAFLAARRKRLAS